MSIFILIIFDIYVLVIFIKTMECGLTVDLLLVWGKLDALILFKSLIIVFSKEWTVV